MHDTVKNEDLTPAARPAAKGSFWSVAGAVTAIVLGANTPLPLLTVYQAEWGFSTGFRCSCRRLHRADPCLAQAICLAWRRG